MKDRALRAILPEFSGKRILIVGDVMVDEYIHGEVHRISPEAPVPVVDIQHRAYTPGGAANTAAIVVSLGGEVLLGGLIGRDYSATQLLAILMSHGINADGLVVDDERPTTTKTRILAHSQQVLRVDHERRTPLTMRLEERLLQWAKEHVEQVDACILSDYAKGVASTRVAEHFIRMARELGKPVIVDPKGTNYTKYRGATVVTPNVREAEQALNREINGDTDLERVGRQLSRILKDSVLLITRGSRGMSLFVNEVRNLDIPAEVRNVFDVTGAGDTVVGTLALALAADASIEEAARLANRAAGIVVTKLGTATVSVEELLGEEPVAMPQNTVLVHGTL